MMKRFLAALGACCLLLTCAQAEMYEYDVTPSPAPTEVVTPAPTDGLAVVTPTPDPEGRPTAVPTLAPRGSVTAAPTAEPTGRATSVPTLAPRTTATPVPRETLDEVPDPETLPYVIRNGRRERPYIAITVEDCDDIGYVKKIFELCEQYQVCATFYPVGVWLKDKDAELWKQIAASPYCEIGSHTYRHNSWSNAARDVLDTYVRLFQTRLDELLGEHYTVKTVRPPNGDTYSRKIGLEATKTILARYGYEHVVLWDTHESTAAKTLGKLQNGSIVLFQTRKKDYEQLRELVPKLRSAGFEPVKVSELLGLDGAATATDLD